MAGLLSLCVVIDCAENSSLWTPDEKGECLTGIITDDIMIRQIFEIEKDKLKSLLFDNSEKKLTPRQLQIVKELKQGKTNKQIAEDMHISFNTVKAHLTTLYKAYNVGTRTGLLYALKD